MILSRIEIVHVWHVHSTENTESTVHVGVAVFRLIRLFRLVRVMKFFKRLNTLVNAFIGALKDIIWVGVLIILMLYAFAVLTTNFFGKNDYLVAQMGNDSSSDMFGSVARSMATLFQMMTLDSWMSGITRPIGDVYAGAFPFFIFFVTLKCTVDKNKKRSASRSSSSGRSSRSSGRSSFRASAWTSAFFASVSIASTGLRTAAVSWSTA